MFGIHEATEAAVVDRYFSLPTENISLPVCRRTPPDDSSVMRPWSRSGALYKVIRIRNKVGVRAMILG